MIYNAGKAVVARRGSGSAPCVLSSINEDVISRRRMRPELRWSRLQHSLVKVTSSSHLPSKHQLSEALKAILTSSNFIRIPRYIQVMNVARISANDHSVAETLIFTGIATVFALVESP